MMREITKALGECGRREIVAIVFDADKSCRAFSAGVAVEEHVQDTIFKMLDAFHSIFRQLEQIAKPAIALVDGSALGGGCELVAACDIVIASDRARFGQPEIKLGVFPPVAPGDGRLLVDGGVLDNLPVEEMSRANEGPIVASDVTLHDGRWAQARRAGRNRVTNSVRRALTGTDQLVPRLGETLFRTFTLGSADTAAAAQAHADLLVTPAVEGAGLMDWKQLPRLRKAGRAAARQALDENQDSIAAWAR